MESQKNRAWLAVALLSVLLICIGIVAQVQLSELVENRKVGRHNNKLIQATHELQRNIASRDSSYKEYLLTGNEKKLAEFNQSSEIIKNSINKLNFLSDEGIEKSDVNQILKLIKIASIEQDKALVDRNNIANSNEAFAAAVNLIEKTQAAKGELLKTRSSDNDLVVGRLRPLVFILSSGSALGLVGILWWALTIFGHYNRKKNEVSLAIDDANAAERKLAQTESIFNQLSENMKEMFWVTSLGAEKIYYMSPAFQEVVGASLEELQRKPQLCFGVLAPEDHLRAIEHLRRDKRTLTGSEGEYKMLRRDGTPLWVQVRTFPVKEDSGEVKRFCGIAYDITQRKEAEKRVSEFYSTVSHELRTPLTSIRGSLGLIEGGLLGEIPEKARQFIEIAREESDRLIRLINDILDIRKIESGKLELTLDLCNVTELLKSSVRDLDSAAKEAEVRVKQVFHDDMTIACDRDRIMQVLVNLISNAIKFSPPGEEVTVNVASAEKGKILRFSVEDHGPGIKPEEEHKLFKKFQQVDSSDSRPKGGTGLGLAIAKAIVEQHGGKIGFKSEPGNGATFWFELPALEEKTLNAEFIPVAETKPFGILLSRDDKLSWLVKLLLALEELPVFTARSAEEVQRMMDRARHKFVLIDADSCDDQIDSLLNKISDLQHGVPLVVIGEGEALQTIKLPNNVTCVAKPLDQEKLRRIIHARSTHIAKVLVVEDDASTRAVLVNQISAIGAHCSEAKNGKRALELASKEKPDLIVLDLNIPAPDGFALVEQWRSGALGDTPLIIYTSLDLTEQDRQNLRLGETKHLTKTKSLQSDFIKAVQELLPREPAVSYADGVA